MEYITFGFVLSLISSCLVFIGLRFLIEKFILSSKSKFNILNVIFLSLEVIYAYIGVGILFSIILGEYQNFIKYLALLVFLFLIPIILFYIKSVSINSKEKNSYILNELLILYTLVPLSIGIGLLTSSLFGL